jgi:hypothetical protein
MKQRKSGVPEMILEDHGLAVQKTMQEFQKHRYEFSNNRNNNKDNN